MTNVILEKFASNPVATFTGILAFLTAVMVWMAYRQEKSLKRIERAYLFAEVIAPEGIRSSPSGFPNRLTIKIWNNGKTPAEVIQLRAYGEIGKDIPQKLVDHPRSNESLPPGYGIASNDAFSLHFDVSVTDAQRGDIGRVHQMLYVVGSVTYRDIFGKKRVTSYCWFYRPEIKDVPFILAPESKLNYRT